MTNIRREMDKGYWDGMAGSYEEEIFSVLHSDCDGLIRKALRCAASKKKTVADIGCGIGHFLPLLSGLFGHVYANDISRELLIRAKESCAARPNIDFLCGDIRAVFKKIPRVDCAVSVNSLISSSAAVRHRMLGAIAAILKPGGYFFLVVPSWESSLLVDIRMAHWKFRTGTNIARAFASTWPSRPLADNKARQGIVPIDGVATKHFLREELELVLADAGLDVLDIRRIRYGWDTEFDRPPRWMRAPYPWDWFVTARRARKA